MSMVREDGNWRASMKNLAACREVLHWSVLFVLPRIRQRKVRPYSRKNLHHAYSIYWHHWRGNFFRVFPPESAIRHSSGWFHWAGNRCQVWRLVCYC